MILISILPIQYSLYSSVSSNLLISILPILMLFGLYLSMKPVERNPMEINNRLAPLQSNTVSITSSQEYGCLRKKKIDELTEVQNDVQYIKEDISLVERHRINLYRARDRYLVKIPVHGGELTGSKTWSSSSINKDTILFPSGKPQGSTQMKEASSGLSSQHTNQSSLAVTLKKRVQSEFNDLQHCYLQKRRQVPNPLQNHDKRDDDVIQREGIVQVYQIFNLYFPLLHNIELRHGELFHSANIVSSIEFHRDDEVFATAGVSRRI
ncbi:hypothetical protein LXL04_031138 [Taraxacum kok-saghyz]